jgi:hypothetical protein
MTLGSELGDIEAKLTMRVGALETLLNDRFAHLDQKLELAAERFEERMDRLEEMVRLGSRP